MHGEKKQKLLNFIENSSQTIEELFFIFTQPYGSNMRSMEYRLDKFREKRLIVNDPEFKKNKLKFYDLMYRLKKQGLIENNNNSLATITQKGQQTLQKLNERLRHNPKNTRYDSKKDDLMKIIIFDIPEEHRSKRAWLRAVLNRLNFKMLQKSVWAGKSKLPEELIQDLKKFNILSYVEIFAINKNGTLKQISGNDN